MQTSKLGRIAAALLGLSLIAAACGDDSKTSSSATTAAATDTTAAAAGATTAAGGVTCPAGTKLAFTGALSGDNGNLGKNMVNGAKLAIDAFNKANPGCQVTFDTAYDSQGDPAQAPALADKIVADSKIIGLIGPGFSGETKATMPTYEKAGLTMITPGATNAQLSKQGWKTFHRILANDDLQAPGIAAYIKGAGAKKVAVVDDASTYGKPLADAVRSGIGALDVSDDQVAKGSVDFSAAVTKIKGSGADYVFYGGYYSDAAKLVKAMRDGGVTATFVSGDGSLDVGFITNAGAAAEGAVLTATGAPPSVNADFQTAFKAAYGTDVTLYAPEAYDCAKVFLDAIAAGKVTRADVQAFVTAYDKPGITKQIKFDATGEPAGSAVYYYVVEKGALVGKGIIKQ
jgi:branched-chain amino acid transport system substrate-binding protein